MADQEDVDFSQLPLPDRFQHKVWKVRKEGYEAAAKAFEVTPDESDPVFRPFIQDPGLWKGAVADSNVAAQQEGLIALSAFLKYGGTQGAQRSRAHTIQPICEKGLTQTRPAAKAAALETLLLYVEIDKPDLIIDDLLPALSNKQPKVIAATLAALTAIFHGFGTRVVEPKPVLKQLPKVFGHADKNVRAEATNLTAELYRWLKEAMKPIFWGDLKPVQQTEIEKLFEKVKEEPAPKQERFTRAQQAQMATARPVAAGGDYGGEDADIGGVEEDEEPVEIDTFDLAEPVDAYSKIPASFQENINSSKWKDRKDALDALFEIFNTPRIKEGPYDDVIRALAKSMKDANIAVVTVAANCVEKLALGLRKGFARYRSSIMTPMIERLKEKKQSVADALGAAMDAVFIATSLSDNLEEILTALTNKNPNVKGESVKFLVRCLRTTRDVPTKDEQKRIADTSTKLLTESTEVMRLGGAEILGTLMKIIGERAMNPYLDGLDESRKTKIKEYFETAEVKAKEKPKAVAPPPKAAPAGVKRPVGGAKKPGLKKAAPPAPVEDSAPLQPRPTAKPLAKPAGVPKPGLTQPSGLKLGGLKKAGPAAGGISSPQRRVISPPVSNASEDEVPVASPSKFGMGRGGLTSRPLSKPAMTTMSPSHMRSASGGLSSDERIELEELRQEKDRLLALCDSLRSSNSKLSTEVTELQNQNAQLIEDHTRDILETKSKNAQLSRAKGEVDILRSDMDRMQKKVDRYERELSRLGRESLGRERDDVSRGRVPYDDAHTGNDNNIYDDASPRRPAQRPMSNLNGSGRSASSMVQRASSSASNDRPQSSYASGLSPSEEKENGGVDGVSTFATKGKMSPPVRSSNAARSPQRPTSMSREASQSSGAGEGGENWKRAAEVTSQLKARIEAMKKRQGLTKTPY